MNHLKLGKKGEKIAQKYLKKQGYEIIDCNNNEFACEIDIICTDKKSIRFVEVKTRSSLDFQNPREAVDFRRRENYKKAGIAFAKKYKLLALPLHFDIIEVVGKTVTYLPDDF